MIQIVLIGIGLFVLAKKRIKISDTKSIARPQTVYLGLIIIAYGVAVFFLPTNLIYYVALFASLLGISAIFIAKGEPITSSEITTKPTDTKRNALILLIFVAIIAIVGYLYWSFV